MTSPDEPQENNQPQVSKYWVAALLWRRWRWLTVSAALGLAALVTVYSFGHSPRTRAEAGIGAAISTGPAASASRGAAAARHGSTDTPEEVVASLHVPPKLAAALTKWEAGPGGSAMAKVTNALGSATQDAGARLYDPMRLACLSLGAAVTTAKAAPPIPDAAMQKWYSLALAKLTAAAADCRTAISVYPYGDEDVKTYENPTLLRQSVSDFATGARDLYQATVDANAIYLQAKRK
jgi:hypothetical protein